jgi:hypothetical protein
MIAEDSCSDNHSLVLRSQANSQVKQMARPKRPVGQKGRTVASLIRLICQT